MTIAYMCIHGLLGGVLGPVCADAGMDAESSAFGCVSRTSDGMWLLTNASEGAETRTLFTSTEEILEAKKKKLGSNRYRLIGTTEFVTKEELLKQPERAAFTRSEVANAIGQLQEGRKVAVKGLLITLPNEKRFESCFGDTDRRRV